MHDEQRHSDEARNDGRHPGVALSRQDPADGSHVVAVAVVVHESVLASEISGQENPSGFGHVVRIGGKVGDGLAWKLDWFAGFEHCSSGSWKTKIMTNKLYSYSNILLQWQFLKLTFSMCYLESSKSSWIWYKILSLPNIHLWYRFSLKNHIMLLMWFNVLKVDREGFILLPGLYLCRFSFFT